MLKEVTNMLDKKINNNEDELFYKFLDYLLEKKADEAYYLQSYDFYRAINDLSASCTIGLYEKKIYVDSCKMDELLNKLALKR